MNYLQRQPAKLFGLTVYESPFLTERVLYARSPSRARRRARRGFRQHYVERPLAVHMKGVGIIVHPTIMVRLVRDFDAHIAAFAQKLFE